MFDHTNYGISRSLYLAVYPSVFKLGYFSNSQLNEFRARAVGEMVCYVKY